MERLNENLRAADVELTQDDLRDINVALAQIDVHRLRGTGQERYS
jgi:diketogulonate reductase-like aldo/keto reductase